MKINKFKKIGKSKYKLFFDNTDIILYEDVILKYDLLIIKNIDEDLLDKLINENKIYDAYYSALSYIEVKMRSKKEIVNYLRKKEYDDEIINDTVNKLINQNLLNNKSYITSYVNDKINLSNDGPYKIKKYLIDNDFDESDIDLYLDSIDNEVWINKIKKLIEKKKSLMKSKSYYMFINKIKNDLYNLGYDSSLVDQELSNISYESDSINKDYNSALRKYKNDKNKIISYMLRKGYSYDEVLSLIKND